MQRKACTSSARSRFNRRCCWLTRCFDQCGNQFQSEFIWVYVKFMLGCLNAWPLFEKPNSISLTCISWGVSDRNAWNQAVTFQTHETQETCPTRDSKGMSLAVCLPWRGVWILWQTARQGLLWLPSLLLIQLLIRYQSLLGQATVVHRTRWWSEGSCPHHLLQARSSRKSRATHGVCSCGLIVVKGKHTDEILRLSGVKMLRTI